MGSKTRIFILHMREIIYAVIFSLLAIIIIILMIYFFNSKDSRETLNPVSTFSPGTYSSTLRLGDYTAEISVEVDTSGVCSASFSDLNEQVKTMYPLLESCMSDISAQLANGTPLNQIQYSSTSQYTATVLIEAINTALQKAAP